MRRRERERECAVERERERGEGWAGGGGCTDRGSWKMSAAGKTMGREPAFVKRMAEYLFF